MIWQNVSQSRDERTDRAAVKGGWLYRSAWNALLGRGAMTGSAIVFVADEDAADPRIEAPVVFRPIPNVVWLPGSPVHMEIDHGTFADLQGQQLTYTANLEDGEPLPDWLTFNPTALVLKGIVPASQPSLSVVITATNEAQLSARDTFAVTVPVPEPKEIP